MSISEAAYLANALTNLSSIGIKTDIEENVPELMADILEKIGYAIKEMV